MSCQRRTFLTGANASGEPEFLLPAQREKAPPTGSTSIIIFFRRAIGRRSPEREVARHPGAPRLLSKRWTRAASRSLYCR